MRSAAGAGLLLLRVAAVAGAQRGFCGFGDYRGVRSPLPNTP